MKTGGLFFTGFVCCTLSSAVLLGAVSQATRPQRQPRQRQVERKQVAALDSFLAGAPAVRRQIVWVAGDGERQPFDQWTPQMKARLQDFYRRLTAGSPDLGIRFPATIESGSGGQVYFTADLAFDIYAANLAHVLFVEANHLVPWSIQSRPGAELEQLVASSSYFARIRPAADNYYPAGIQANRDFAEPPEDQGLGELTGDPRVAYDFVSGKTSASHTALVGANELETLVNLTAWLRDNVDHGPMAAERVTPDKGQRWLDERLRGFPPGQIAIALQGCHSASKLMVDLARSVNIPLLHVRALDSLKGDAKSHFFNRTHGGLVYGWGGRAPRILWHTDEIYAMPGRTCFPIDSRTGALAAPRQAAQQYFDEIWVTPEQLAKAGFVYRLERVLPEQGFGHTSRRNSEDRYDYGTLSGYWQKKGTSQLDLIDQLNHDSALCSGPLLQTAARRNGLRSYLTGVLRRWKGDFTDEELPQLLSIEEYSNRAAACLQAIGGADKLPDMIARAKASRGKTLLAGQ